MTDIAMRVAAASRRDGSVMTGDAPPEDQKMDLLSKILDLASLIPSPGSAAVAIGSLVPARPFLKGMAGVHPGFDMEQFLKMEALKAPAKAMEKKYGIIRTPEGLKTNVSDAGTTLDTKYLDRLKAGEQVSFDDLMKHPNKETIQAAVRDPNLFRNITVQPASRGSTSYGSYTPSEDLVELNLPLISKDAKYLTPEQEATAVLLHEGTGHAVQARVGWQGGSSVRIAASHPATTDALRELRVAPNSDELVTQLIAPRVTQKHLSSMDANERRRWVTDLIAEQTYLKMAGEQGAEAPSKLFRLNAINKDIDPHHPITELMTTPLLDQLYK